MGFAMRYLTEAIRCEYRSCGARFALATPLTDPKPVWSDVIPDLAQAVRAGWAVVLISGLRAYCPSHRATAAECSCLRRYKPERQNRCVVHCDSVGPLLWNDRHIPAEVIDDPSVRLILELEAR